MTQTDKAVAGSGTAPSMKDVYAAIWDARALAWKAHYDNVDLVPISHDRLLRAVEQLGFALQILSGKSGKTEVK